ncbi:hypothetical protein GCM10023187_47120 [Nibrella viscosa]|uniref:DUF4249 domain-containing protein n=1 Tax=Nibrella viscosa TaxID=1084524 RepID=A0ABP8KUB5_9BACT
MKTTLLSLLVLGLLSCNRLEQEVRPVALISQPAKLTVVCFIAPQDTILTAKVTVTRPILSADSKSTEVTNATVRLAEGSRTVTFTYDLKNKYYSVRASQFPIEAGKTYTLTVTTPDGKKAVGTCAVPRPVPLAGIQFDSLTTSWPSQGKRYFMRLRWQDPAGQKNYYRPSGLFSSVSAQTPGVSAVQPLSFEGEFNGKLLISDQDQDGNLLDSGRGYLDGGKATTAPSQTFGRLYRTASVAVSLLHLDPNYYAYHESVQRQDATDGNPFAEPVLITTNIVGGIGCFGAYNRSVVVLKLR